MPGIPGADLAVDSLEALLARLESGEGLAEDAVVQAAKGGVATVEGVALGVVDTVDKAHDSVAAEVVAAIKHGLEAARALAGTTPAA